MLLSRRNMLKLSTAGGALAAIQSCGNPEDSSESSAGTPEDRSRRPTVEELDRAAAAPLLKLDGLTSPVIIDSIQLLQRGREQIVHVRSKDGAEGISFTNGRPNFQPILEDRIVPFFIGKDARQLESELLFELYRYRSNYKLQGLAFWSAQAWVEFAILDMLGRVAGKSMNELFGGGARQSAPFYVASGNRDSTPEEEADYLAQLVEETGAKAVKFRVGGRMSRNRDSMPSRTESLIWLARKTLGDGIDIHADSNSSYDPPEAIKVGRILEEVNAVFFEEPCPFDHLEDTKKVTDALTIPVAGGEQEFSERRFRWMIHKHGVDIVQPDLHYYGGMIRSLRVAKMAALANMPTTPHISGGFGFVYVLHFTACVTDVGRYQEYKRGIERYKDWFNPPLEIRDGALSIPRGPGVGIKDIKAVLRETHPVA